MCVCRDEEGRQKIMLDERKEEKEAKRLESESVSKVEAARMAK